MGKSHTRLRPFDAFSQSLHDHAKAIVALKHNRLRNLRNEDATVGEIDRIIRGLELGISGPNSRLVVSTKALHHLLPELVAPIDREYTLRFFYSTKTPSKLESRFVEIAPWLSEFASRNADYIRERVESENSWHTSSSKVVDNAIIGFVFAEGLKGR